MMALADCKDACFDLAYKFIDVGDFDDITTGEVVKVDIGSASQARISAALRQNPTEVLPGVLERATYDRLWSPSFACITKFGLDLADVGCQGFYHRGRRLAR